MVPLHLPERLDGVPLGGPGVRHRPLGVSRTQRALFSFGDSARFPTRRTLLAASDEIEINLRLSLTFSLARIYPTNSVGQAEYLFGAHHAASAWLSNSDRKSTRLN